MATVEGHWKDTGGSAGSLKYLNSYECTVRDLSSNGKEAITRMRAGDMIEVLIFHEQVRNDPWEVRQFKSLSYLVL